MEQQTGKSAGPLAADGAQPIVALRTHLDQTLMATNQLRSILSLVAGPGFGERQ